MVLLLPAWGLFQFSDFWYVRNALYREGERIFREETDVAQRQRMIDNYVDSKFQGGAVGKPLY